MIAKLREAGAEIIVGDNWIELDMKSNRPQAVTIVANPYPAFPTEYFQNVGLYST